LNYQGDNYSPNTQFSIFPPAVKHLLIVNLLVFVALSNPMLYGFLMEFGALWPIGSGMFAPWQLVTYMFLHAGFGHILFNLFALWIFGQGIENYWGTKRFATLLFFNRYRGCADSYVDRRNRRTYSGCFRCGLRNSDCIRHDVSGTIYYASDSANTDQSKIFCSHFWCD
jgi:hypothetical protein